MDAIAALAHSVALEQRQDTADTLSASHTPETVWALAERSFERADKACLSASRAVPPPSPIACGPNCPYCCHVRVTASAVELLNLFHAIEAEWRPPTLAVLDRKLANVDRLTRGADGASRNAMRLPCPLLTDGSCAAHTARPLACRAVSSIDVAACKGAYRSRMKEGVPMFAPQHRMHHAVQDGLQAGLSDQERPALNIELNGALAIWRQDWRGDAAAMTRQWLAGEDVFSIADKRPAPTG